MLPSRKRTQGGASLCPGLSPFAPLGPTDQEQARGQRREGTAKQPENFGAILRRYPRITQNAGTVPGYFLRCVLVSIPVLKEILLMSRLASSKTAQIWAERFAWGGRSNAPVAKRTQGGASLCPGLSPFAPLGRTDRWIWLATWQQLANS